MGMEGENWIRKPRIWNRNYVDGPLGRQKLHDYRMPWGVHFGKDNQEYAIAETQQDAVQKFIDLQWSGRLPAPEDY